MTFKLRKTDMKKYAIAALATLALTSAMADQLTWVEMTHSEDRSSVMSVARETTRIAKNDNNEQVVLTTGKAVIDEKINTFQWYVRISDCRQKFGRLTYLNLNGGWLADGDFAFGNETMSTQLAQGLCDWALNVALKPTPKSVTKPSAKPAKATI